MCLYALLLSHSFRTDMMAYTVYCTGSRCHRGSSFGSQLRFLCFSVLEATFLHPLRNENASLALLTRRRFVMRYI